MCTSSTASSSGSSSTCNYFWTSWVSEYDTSGTSSTTADSAWSTWVGEVTYVTSTSTTTSTTINYVWEDWVDSSYTENEEQARERQPEASNSDDQWKKRQEERKAAEAKAVELLQVLIGEEQTKVYMETGRVFLRGKKFDYHIVKGSGFNIRKIEKDKVRDLCVHINKSIYPDTDNVVALLLALQDDEEAILKMANDHGASRDTPIEDLPRAAVAGG